MYGLEVPSRPTALDRTARAELTEFSTNLKWVWRNLPTPITLEWSESLVVALDQGSPWVYGPVERDPLRHSGGGSVMPRQVLKRLKKKAKLGLPFQRLAIAHELDRDGPASRLLPALEAGPRVCPDEVARELVGDVPAHPGVARAVRVMDAAVGGATSAAGVTTHLVSSLLDPIVFGVVAPQPPRHGELCLWYPLAAWRW
jgi:hypothetical protein